MVQRSMQRHAHRLLCSALATVAVASFLLLISAEHLGMASGAKAACDTPDLSGCAAEAFSPSYTECVTALIAGRGEPSPFVPAARGTKFKYAGKPGPASGKHPVAYLFSKDGPAQHGKTDPGGTGAAGPPSPTSTARSCSHSPRSAPARSSPPFLPCPT